MSRPIFVGLVHTPCFHGELKSQSLLALFFRAVSRLEARDMQLEFFIPSDLLKSPQLERFDWGSPLGLEGAEGQESVEVNADADALDALLWDGSSPEPGLVSTKPPVAQRNPNMSLIKLCVEVYMLLSFVCHSHSGDQFECSHSPPLIFFMPSDFLPPPPMILLFLDWQSYRALGPCSSRQGTQTFQSTFICVEPRNSKSLPWWPKGQSSNLRFGQHLFDTCF